MTYMTVQEFADELRMCYRSVLNAIKSGKIYAIRPGRGKKSAFRIPRTELERLQVSSMYQVENK